MRHAQHPCKFGIMILLLAASTASGQAPSFSWFGPINTDAKGISADGQVVTGKFYPSSGSRAFRHIIGGTMLDLGTLGGNYSEGNGISGDGNVIVGFSDTDPDININAIRAFKWSGSGMANLGTLAGHSYSVADDVSADGSVVVGVSGVALSPNSFRAVRWDAGGMEDLGVLPGLVYSHAYGVSDDGSTAVGFSAGPGVSRPVSWRNGAVQQIGTGIGTALAASADGSVIVGDMNSQAFRWSEATGTVQFLGVLPGHLYSTAWGVSADGSVVTGFCHGGGNTTAFRWVVGGQMKSVGTLLAEHGILPDSCWACSYGYDISADGTTIVGQSCYPEDGSEGCAGYVAVVPVDSDGDGLLDQWESQDGGIDGDGDGDIDLYLYDMGARSDHKDLFVEIDTMAGVQFSADAAQMVAQAFANSPHSNPDGTTGIALHFIATGQGAIPFEEVWHTESGGCWPEDFAAAREAHFGDVGDPLAVRSALARAVRYCIAINQLTDPVSSAGYGGCGEMPGDDFVIAIGGQDAQTQAGIFMHELGHTLGLNHGGGDGLNGKPNYVSIMNYTLAYESDFSSSFWKLDYSRSNLGVLFEFNLYEDEGLPAPAGFDGSIVRMPFGFDRYIKGELVREMGLATLSGAPINWDGDAYPNETGDDVDNHDLNYAGPSCPVLGLNTPNPDEPLNGFDDWANIKLAIPADTALANAPNYPTNEPPPASVLVAWLNANIPSLCPADITGNSIVDVDDLLLVINNWGAAGPNVADINGDLIVDVDDLLAVINGWGGCE